MNEVVWNEQEGMWEYLGDTFKIRMTMYTDPERKRLARSAARYLGKKDIGNIRRPLSIIRKGHVPEIFRGEHVEFEFIDVSKEVYDHIVTYTTRDMRVAGGNRALKSADFTLPSDKMKDNWMVNQMVEESFNRYQTLLKAGETPQVARAAMPTAAKMNPFTYQFNFLTLGQSLFNQRVWDKGAQGNTVKVCKGMLALCIHMDKELWETFYEYFGTPMLQWKEVRRKLKANRLTVGNVFDILSELKSLHEHDAEKLKEVGNQLFLDFVVEKYGELPNMW